MKAKRRAICWNGFLWGVGNGALGSTLLIYLIMDIADASNFQEIGLPVAWIIAAPRLAGVFRISTPILIDWVNSRKRVCLIFFTTASLILGFIPVFVPLLMRLKLVTSAIFLIILLWCIYHLLEYMATTAMWSWFGDMIHLKIRGRFIAVRERHILTGQMLGMVVTTAYMSSIGNRLEHNWEKNLGPALFGCVFLCSSAIPLVKIPEIPWKKRSFQFCERFTQIFKPCSDIRFLRLCLFGSLINFANGMSQSSQNIAHKTILPDPVFNFIPQFVCVLLLMNFCRLGQITVSPMFGKLIDRFGNLRIMRICMAIVASGSFFYFFAMRSTPWWIVGAWFVWIFWVGINVGVVNLLITYAPPGERTSYLAFYFALTAVVLAFATLGGGYLFDLCAGTQFRIPAIQEQWSWSELSFILSGLLRLLAIPLLK
ncbi:MAG: MFS transporter [Planctomycetaceae bacterium]|jgi:MFS family permease|nr:MFS transporter [Planctomycetaceae bacterium]